MTLGLRRALAFAVLAAVSACGGDTDVTPPSAPARPSTEDLVARDLAAAYFAEDMMQEARESLAPLVSRANPAADDLLAAAVVEVADGRVAEGLRLLSLARPLVPDSPAVAWNLARIARHNGQFESSLAHLRRVHALAPDDVPTRLSLGNMLSELDQVEEAERLYREILSVGVDYGGSWYMAALYQLARLRFQVGRMAEGEEFLHEFTRLQARGLKIAPAGDVDRGTFGKLPPPRPAGAAQASPVAPPSLPAATHVMTEAAGAVGLLAADPSEQAAPPKAPGEPIYSRPVRPAVVSWGPSGLVVAERVEGEWRTRTASAEPFSLVRSVDLDGDGLLDFVAVSGNRLRILAARGGAWEVVEVGLADFAAPPADVEVLDYDHDGDLDLAVVGGFGARLLRNDGALKEGGRFADVTTEARLPVDVPFLWCVSEDFDTDKDVDLLVGGERGCRLADNVRMGRFIDRTKDLGDPFAASSRPAVLDLDGDGRPDLWFPGPPPRLLRSSASGRFASSIEDSKSAPRAGPPVVIADIDLDGAADVLWPGASALAEGRLGLAIPGEKALTWTAKGAPPSSGPLLVADFNDDLRADVARLGARGAEVFLAAAPSGPLAASAASHALLLALRGMKDNRRGVGAVVEVRAGAVYRRIFWRGEPVVVGLGRAERADVVRVTWPNGVVQSETHVPGGAECLVVQRESHAWSCPFLYTWDGRRFVFGGDVLGHSPLGLDLWPGGPFAPDLDEVVRIPGSRLVPRNGGYEIQITEELKEVSYIDRLRLEVVDHPIGTDVYPDERAGPPPYPDGRVVLVGATVPPTRAVGSDGRDWTVALSAADGVRASPFTPYGGNLAGFGPRHFVEVSFDPSAVRSAKRLRLLLSAWFEWIDASSLRAARGTPGVTFEPPVLLVPDGHGGWRAAGPTIGFPAGSSKALVIDVTDSLVREDPRVRIATTLAIHWDSIRLAADAGDARLRTTTLAPTSARLDRRGFSAAIPRAGDRRLEDYDFGRLDRSRACDPLPGLVTRLGDVTPLLGDGDDRFVILAPGDSMSVRFEGEELAPPPPGVARDFLLHVTGWTKDGDPNTPGGGDVPPLPFASMSRYPYASPERFPDDDTHRRWLSDWTTRVPEPWLAPLSRRAGP